jgi:hypothetical protein
VEETLSHRQGARQSVVWTWAEMKREMRARFASKYYHHEAAEFEERKSLYWWVLQRDGEENNND